MIRQPNHLVEPVEVAVCVPARNERGALPALLSGLAAQTEYDLSLVTLCIFLDDCSDGSTAILRDHARFLPFSMRIEAGPAQSVANAGRARRAAMAIGRAALRGTDGILLTTDADSVPATDWITRSCAALRVADVVAGRIARQQPEPCAVQDRIESYYDRLVSLRRQLDPVPWDGGRPHHFTGGANLGFRVTAYDALGGFLELASGEDARIVDDAARLGLRVRRERSSLVHTSSRRVGRAIGGLATHLHALDRSARVTVAHPADAAWQYRMQAHARSLFAQDRLDRVAELLTLSTDHVIGVARECANAEAFAMRMVPTPPGGVRNVALDEAERMLTILETQPMGQAA